MTFDGWETLLTGDAMALPTGQLSDNTLMHFRTKGSKNGVRRYQTESGEWTPLGLKERKIREGWGDRKAKRYQKKVDKYLRKQKKEEASDPDSEKGYNYGKKAQRYILERNRAKGLVSKKEYKEILKYDKKQDKYEKSMERAEKKVAQLSKKKARQDARKEARAALAEKRRKNDVKNMTDEEIQKRIARIKLEQEYKELTKSPLLKNGEQIITNYLKNRAEKNERDYQDRKAATEFKRDMEKLKEQTRQTELRETANKARAEADRERAKTDYKDIESGTRLKKLKNEAKNLKLQKKRYHSDNTISGGIQKMLNSIASARGEGRSERINERAFVSSILRGRKRIDRYNRKLDPWEPKQEYDPDAWNREKNRRDGKNNKQKKDKEKDKKS